MCLALLPLRCTATVEDAFSYALQAAAPYIKEGFTLREDYWGGDLPVKQQKAIVQQLFKGSEYWFWMGTDSDSAKITINIYDADGNLAGIGHWQKSHLPRPASCRKPRAPII